MKNAIVTCATPSWIPLAATTLLSCARHGLDDNTDLVIVVSEHSQLHFDELKFFNAKHQVNIKLITTNTKEFQNLNFKRYTVASFLRLKLDKVLSKDYQRVLYLDCDVLAGSSCKELLMINLNGFPLGAVEDLSAVPWITKNAQKIKQQIGMGLDLPYFNSGVLLFDWQQVLKLKILTTSRAILATRIDWPVVDQDVINLCFAEKWQPLPPKWNIEKRLSGYLFLKPGIRHFTGSQKPWNSPNRIGHRKYYNIYVSSLKDTPWSNFIPKQNAGWPLRPNLLHIIRKCSIFKRRRLLEHFKKTTGYLDNN